MISASVREIANKRLNDMGLEPVFYPTTFRKIEMTQRDKIDRANDINKAFSDPEIAGVMTILGGHSSVHVLEYLDFEVIKRNPKLFSGYSDVTILNVALYSKAGLKTLSGPHYSSLGMDLGLEETLESFKRLAFAPEEKVTYSVAKEWSNDHWYLDQKARTFIPNDGPLIVNPGKSQGTLIGGNLCTMALLTGTSYLDIPDKDVILFIEDDFETNLNTFDRILFGLTEAIGCGRIKGILIGRFEKTSNISDENIRTLFKHRHYFSNIPIIANLDFGHTTPMISIPYGGWGEIKADTEFEFIYSVKSN
jgi:muramoyltetrapeptide carboxypeptidase LdcA involved in peptidoglycan recycling